MTNTFRFRLLLTVPVVLAACGDDGSSATTDQGGGSKADMAAPAGSDLADDRYVPTGYTLMPYLSATAEHMFDAADMVLAQGKDYQAVIETTAGRMVIDLYENDTPVTVNSFVFLAQHHYFDGIAFHRVINGFMAQTGDPNTLQEDRSSWGAGGPGYYFQLETKPNLKFDGVGVVGMARANNPNTNGSQFFITFAAQPSLDANPPMTAGYTVFGKLTEGLGVLTKIKRGEVAKNTLPPDPTVMTRVYIVEK